MNDTATTASVYATVDASTRRSGPPRIICRSLTHVYGPRSLRTGVWSQRKRRGGASTSREPLQQTELHVVKVRARTSREPLRVGDATVVRNTPVLSAYIAHTRKRQQICTLAVA